ncbi:MAG: metallophosphoesterase [Alphaproteobacteria bacterium]|nr:metallophosphoesterase [Rhodospirillales bacterium]MCW9045569.1 metallophosphoesterase [Alphaproteobacteria bacterium]
MTLVLQKVIAKYKDAQPKGKAPENTVLYAIGDIHGRDDLLESLHLSIIEDANKRSASRRVVVYLGDYMSRGPSARKVMDILTTDPLPGFEKIFLKGNHEDIIGQFLAGDLTWGTHWLNYGGINALATYGIKAFPTDRFNDSRLSEILKSFKAALPKSHTRFLEDLSFSHREGEYIFVHAGLTPGVPLEECNIKDLMWIRKSFHISNADHGGIVIHGHTITNQPEVHKNRIGIDTGAYMSGVLTCFVAEGDQCWFMQTAGSKGKE